MREMKRTGKERRGEDRSNQKEKKKGEGRREKEEGREVRKWRRGGNGGETDEMGN